MKRIISIILISVLLLSLCSCTENDGYKTYTEGKITLRLPETLTKKNVQYADVYYSDQDMYVMLYAFSNSYIKEELGLYEKITVTDYVNLYASWNGYSGNYVYNEERDAAQFDEVTSFSNDYSSSYEYEYYLFIRRDAGIYVVLMGCDADKKEVYKPIFEYIDTTVTVAG
jgi:hypothetical protein